MKFFVFYKLIIARFVYTKKIQLIFVSIILIYFCFIVLLYKLIINCVKIQFNCKKIAILTKSF